MRSNFFYADVLFLCADVFFFLYVFDLVCVVCVVCVYVCVFVCCVLCLLSVCS